MHFRGFRRDLRGGGLPACAIRCHRMPSDAAGCRRSRGPYNKEYWMNQAWSLGCLEAETLGSLGRLEGLVGGSKACWLGGLAR